MDQQGGGKWFSIKWCGAAHSLTDTSFAFIEDEKELAQASVCENCDHQVPPRTMMCDGDIMEVGCLCGKRSYSDTDGYTDREWQTDHIARLFGVNRQGEPQMHVFRQSPGSPSLREQISEFCRANRNQLPVMMPMDPLPGVAPALVEQALRMARDAYMQLHGAFHIAHHYEAQYVCV